MPAMPLLHRRSVLDLAHPPRPNTSHQNEERPPRPSNATSLAPPPTSPRPVSEYARPASRPSTATDHADRPTSPTVQPENARTKRFSMLKFRNFSESHLSARAKEDAAKEIIPPMPELSRVNTPAIVKTAPTFDHEQLTAAQTQGQPYAKSLEKTRSQASDMSRLSEDYPIGKDRKSTSKWRKLNRRSTGLEDLQRLSAANAHKGQEAPPAYGNHLDSDLALPAPRFSESSRSDGSHGSSGDHQIYGSTTTTTHTVSTHTTFFKLPRRNKNRNSLFPLPVKVPSPDPSRLSEGPTTPRASTSGVSLRSQQSTDSRIEPINARARRHTEASPTRRQAHQNQLASSPHALTASNSFIEREETQRSRDSSFSSPLRPPMRFGLRDRAATTSSWGRGSMDTPQAGGSGRTSVSTTGRSSFGGFLGLSRFRHDSGPHSPRNGSPSSRSKSNSFAMSREALVVVPEREEGDTPGKYLERLEAAVNRSMIAGILSKSSDPFAQAVLRSYTRRFPFFGEPIDMSLRKFLLEADLPKETQQVDRVIQAFADRYHECNPGIFMSSDQAYIIAFSLMMLHTDAFNRNNKRKMQKHDYIKNTSGQHVSEDVLGCFYDNICYTPFVHYEEEVDINGERVLPFKSKKSKLKGAITDSGKKVSGPVDPYNLLVDQKLDLLRPPIKDVILLEDPYNYIGSQGSLDMQYLQRAFTHTGTLQIISARSRPAAYEGQVNTSNPHTVETQQGIVDLKITKVGTLWRKAVKKKKARSPWQEWGAILTGSQLYLFKNASWVKGLVHQFMSHQRQGAPRMPVTFSPPLHDFKPDALIKTDNAVALIDATYVRHKHAFTFVRHGGQEEVLLADNESELNDWLSLINYAAAFRAAGVRIRGMICGSEECNRPHRPHDQHRPESAHTTHSPIRDGAKSPTYDPGLTRQVMTARRQIMMQKISEYDKELASLQKQHDDILRNSRHLLILSPIPPKTREDIVHAAERTDTMLTWVRRDIWKMRCHRDILALDVEQDGFEVGGVQNTTDKRVETQTDAPDTAKKVLPRSTSHLSSHSPRSQPESPRSPSKSERSPSGMRPRPPTTDSMDTFVDDIFRSPVESPHSPGGDGWRLPPLQFDVEQQRDKHRGSIASTLLTAASNTSQRQPSWSASSTSSRQPRRLNSPERSESLRIITPTTSTGREELGSRPQEEVRTPDSGITRAMNLDGVVSTPESDRTAKGKRRSLQKTLRDHRSSVSQRHRRNKESESTVRSADGENSDHPEATPGLERAQGRFILHGKQASVVQFGNDWPTERMRARREKWHKEHGSPGKEEGDRAPEFPMGSPAVQDLDDDEDSTTATRSMSTAESFVDAPETRRASGVEGDNGNVNGFDPYDLSWDPRSEKRVTVIGPQPNLNIPRSPPALDSTVDEDEEGQSDYEDAKENRRTVIGPPAFVFPDNRHTAEEGSDVNKDEPNDVQLQKASIEKSA